MSDTFDPGSWMPRTLRDYGRCRSVIYQSFESAAATLSIDALQVQLKRFVEEFEDVGWLANLVAFDGAILKAIKCKQVADFAGASLALSKSIQPMVDSPQLGSFGPDTRFLLRFLDDEGKEILRHYFPELGKRWEIGLEKIAAWARFIKSGDRQALSLTAWATMDFPGMFGTQMPQQSFQIGDLGKRPPSTTERGGASAQWN